MKVTGDLAHSVPPLRNSVSVPGKNAPTAVVCAAIKGASSSDKRTLTSMVFEPFEKVKKELDLVPTVPQVSLARHNYVDESEVAVNEQIKMEMITMQIRVVLKDSCQELLRIYLLLNGIGR